MRLHYFIKEGESPVWIRVPGTPFTLLGSPTKYERLPGMTEWAPRPVVERVGKGLQQKIDPGVLAQQEGERGLPWTLGKGGIGGLTAGALAARLSGGEASVAPFKEMLSKGLSRETLKGLKNLPRAAKILPLAGAGAGLLGGAAYWQGGRGGRTQQAEEVAKGLLSEKILQTKDINAARRSVSALQGLPHETATAEPPVVVTPGNTGV